MDKDSNSMILSHYNTNNNEMLFTFFKNPPLIMIVKNPQAIQFSKIIQITKY